MRTWLAQSPSLAELKDAFPAEWKLVKDELARVLDRRDPQAVKDYARDIAKPPRPRRVTTGSREEAELLAMVRQHMAAAALRQMGVSAITGVQSGKLRFNLINGFLAQRLLFEDGLTRKPVSLAWFRLIWPLVWQKKFLLPLVQPKGIYNFYSRRCITRLAHLIGDRRTLEIAAGDGTLTRFLCSEGVDIIATDDLSWPGISPSEHVARLEARQALRAHSPQAVVCSWPPADNAFEQWVFKTPSVQLYIVVSSRHESAAGNWTAYRSQTTFDWAIDEELSRLVLPPELDSAIYVFRRRKPAEQ